MIPSLLRSPFSIPISLAAPTLKNLSAAPPSRSSSPRLSLNVAIPRAPATKLCPAFSRWPPSPPSPTPSHYAEKIAPSPPSAFANSAVPSARVCVRSSPPPCSIRLLKNSPPSTSPSASPRASTPPAAWMLPPKSSNSSAPAMPPALSNSPPSLNCSTASDAMWRPLPSPSLNRAWPQMLTSPPLACSSSMAMAGIAASSASSPRASSNAPPARHRGQHRRRHRPRFWPLRRRLSTTRGPRILRRPLHPLRRPCLCCRLRHARRQSSRTQAPPCFHANDRLASREPELLLRIHAELPLNRITSVLAGWLRKLEPLGHGNPEPIFVARNARLASPPRIMKERHLRLELVQQTPEPAAHNGVVRAVGWDWASRCLI